MALAISNIPILTGKVAENFVRKANEAEQNKGSIDFSEQRNLWKDFEGKNSQRIKDLKASDKWPY